MTIVLHAASYLLVAAIGWLGLLLLVATIVHGRAWVWARVRSSCHGAVGRRSLRRHAPGQRLPPRSVGVDAVGARRWLR